MRGDIKDDDHADLRQEYEIERAIAARDGRKPRPRSWVEADYWRKRFGRGGHRRALSSGWDVTSIASAPISRSCEEARADLLQHALTMARSLPREQRLPIEMALRCLASRRCEDRLRAWLDFNPGRVATHRVIAAECGVSRETVTRAISRLRKRRINH
jgi:hypothetical protein